MKVALVAGSASSNAHTKGLLIYLQSLFLDKQVQTELWDLSSCPLPVLLPEYHSNPMKSPVLEVRKFVKLIEDSDAVVLATPLYHGSYSGVLKNALDHLRYNSFQNKPVGLVTNASNLRNTVACEYLRPVVRTLYGYATQTQIGTEDGDYENKKEGYRLVDQSMKDRCQRLVQEMISLSYALKKM